MHIVRGPRRADQFTVLSNALLRDDTLSFRARGVLFMLLSYTDGVHITADTLAARSTGEGRRAILTAFKELRAAGFLHLHRVQGKGGRWTSAYTVYEEPRTPAEAAHDAPRRPVDNPAPTEVPKPHSGEHATEVRSPAAGPCTRNRSTTREGLKAGANPPPAPATPALASTNAPPPCRRHPNGWHHDEPCRACMALRQHDQQLTAPQPAPKPPHCGHCDIVDRTISHADAFGHLVLTPCPRCSPRRMAPTQLR